VEAVALHEASSPSITYLIQTLFALSLLSGCSAGLRQSRGTLNANIGFEKPLNELIGVLLSSSMTSGEEADVVVELM